MFTLLTLLLPCTALLPALSPSASAQAAAAGRVERRVGAMGTTLALTVDAADRSVALAASEAALRALEAVEARLSTWRDDSELVHLNAAALGQPFALSAELAADLARARELWRATDGAFDPALGGLVAVWGLRSGGPAGGRSPSEEELERARPAAGFAALDLQGRTATRLDERLVLEEGGFGKGVGLDAAARALQAAGATSAVFDFGGQTLVWGALSDDVAFAIADPERRERGVVRVRMQRGSLATSGNSERGIVVDGVRQAHLIDPRNGRPAPDWGSLTVLAPDATTADALSTGLYVLGPERALAFAAAHEGIEVIVLERTTHGLTVQASDGLEGRVESLDPDLGRIRFVSDTTRRRAAEASTSERNDTREPPGEPR